MIQSNVPIILRTYDTLQSALRIPTEYSGDVLTCKESQSFGRAGGAGAG